MHVKGLVLWSLFSGWSSSTEVHGHARLPTQLSAVNVHGESQDHGAARALRCEQLSHARRELERVQSERDRAREEARQCAAPST